MSELQLTLFAVDAGLPRETPEGSIPASALPTQGDLAARRSALDTGRSILLQAPAGAGKTSLLTQRYLALLAEVTEPEEILAITFTRAATAEMRGRIFRALEAARQAPGPEGEAGETNEQRLARRALRHADALGWALLEQPHRLDVQTIDSLCLRLAHGQPLLARLGGSLQPTEDASALYATAARRTIARLGDSAGPELDEALRTLLLLRDNNLPELERLLAAMLGRRDAWLGFPPLRAPETVDWAAVRRQLEQPFADEHHRVLRELRATLQAAPDQARDLLELGRYAAANLDGTGKKGLDLRALRTFEHLPGVEPGDRESWLALASLLLTKGNTWRKEWERPEGFPPAGSGPGKGERARFNKWMKQCSTDLQAHPQGGDKLLQLFCRLRTLPALRYTEDQWQTLGAVFRVLRRAAAELRLVFAEENAVDFVEIAQAAEAVLRDGQSMRGLLESEGKRHLLIDEFQDTSRAQYRLVAELLREWSPGDGRTVFLVGDPLQSIYGFRQADVTLFHETRERGLPCGDRRHPCHPLQLTHNFRSHGGLVSALNKRFEPLFAASPADRFVAAEASPSDNPEHSEAESFQLHTFFSDDSADQEAAERKGAAREAEARRVCELLRAEQPRIAAAKERGKPEYRVAVLVSARSHLLEIAPALRAEGISFRAVELEPLADQPEVNDLHILLRALLHPADRVAWLQVLRAPWCGLLLSDLHTLCGEDDPQLLRKPLPELMETRAGLLSQDGQGRLARVGGALRAALRTRYSEENNLSLAGWVERTWTALGGPACVGGAARENVEAFFRLLDTVEPSGIEVLRGDFALRLARLCAAPDTSVSERFGVQLMTMHKAKGLGFEVVLLPGLERVGGKDGAELVAVHERSRPGHAEEDELLLAPIGSREEDTDPTYCWVTAQKKALEAAERKRLFYVACTRARTRLHLLATLKVSKGELRKPEDNSLLGAAWPALREDVEAMWQRRQADTRPAPAATLSLAAAAEPAQDVNLLYRLPAGWQRRPWDRDVRGSSERRPPVRPLFERAEGSLLARARGTAMHAALERLVSLLAAHRAQDLGQELGQDPGLGSDHNPDHNPDKNPDHNPDQNPDQKPDQDPPPHWKTTLERAAGHALRAQAFPPDKLRATAAAVATEALAVAATRTGRWLLGPHPEAQAESTWQSLDADGNLRILRVDRCFLAGETPGDEGEGCLWVIDYKTGAREPRDPAQRAAWLEEQRRLWQPQLQAYAAAIRAAAPVQRPARLALYFPELLHLLAWPAD